MTKGRRAVGEDEIPPTLRLGRPAQGEQSSSKSFYGANAMSDWHFCSGLRDRTASKEASCEIGSHIGLVPVGL
jgi:hypothetical protein